MKCLQNIEIDGLVFLGCIYPRLTTDNTAVGPIGPMGAGKLRAGVRVRALKMNSPAVTGFRQISDFASIFLLGITLIVRESHGNGWYLIQKYPGVV